MDKLDGSRRVVGDVENFRVLEFSKDNRRILVSHTSTFKENESENLKKQKTETKKAVTKIQKSQHKSTLGDLDELSNLKDDLKEK